MGNRTGKWNAAFSRGTLQNLAYVFCMRDTFSYVDTSFFELQSENA